MRSHGTFTIKTKGMAMTRDIICGMSIEESDPATLVKSFLGRKFYFCSGECLLLFSEEPVYFLTHISKDSEIAIDFVCGMNVERKSTPYFLQHKGITFCFCSRPCKEHFENNPQKYVGNFEPQREGTRT